MNQQNVQDSERKRLDLLRAVTTVSCLISGGIALIQNPLLGVGLIIAGILILMDKMWAPILGLICSIIISIYSVIILVLSSLFFRSLILDYVSNNIFNVLLYIIFFILVMNLMTIVLLFYYRKVYVDYWSNYYDARSKDKQPKEKSYGVCPRCKCSEVKFVDGIKYKCAKCGFLY